LVTAVVRAVRPPAPLGGTTTHMGTIDRGSRASARASAWALAIRARCCTFRVQRDGDGSENADDRTRRHQELDQRESVLTVKSHALLVPKLGHVSSLGWMVDAAGRRNQQETCQHLRASTHAA